MSTTQLVTDFIFTSLVAGILGASAMEAVMWLITREGWAKANMIVAVGSLITRSRENALRTGIALHAVSSFGFAMLYAFAMMKLGLSHLPTSFFVGIGFGFIHGLIVSLMLVWVVAEKHPLEEFQEAGLAIGVSHLAGHVAYGAFVGLAVGLSPL
jgi:hypothetical protein